MTQQTLSPVRSGGALPVHRGIVALDAEGPVRRSNGVRGGLRKEIHRLLEDSLRAAGINDEHRDIFADRDDGVLALIRPVDELPKTLLLDAVVPALARLAGAYNTELPPAERPLRLRAVVHSGEVHLDGRNCFGEAVDVAFRLLRAPRTPAGPGDPVVLVISEEIYYSIVRHGYVGIDRDAFTPFVRFQSGRVRRSWLNIGCSGDTLADSGAAPTR